MEPFDDYLTEDDLKLFEEAFKEREADLIKNPGHYARYDIEPMTYIMRNKMEFWRGNCIKYVSRAGHKVYDGMDKVESEITDLQKAIRYAEARINMLKGETTL